MKSLLLISYLWSSSWIWSVIFTLSNKFWISAFWRLIISLYFDNSSSVLKRSSSRHFAYKMITIKLKYLRQEGHIATRDTCYRAGEKTVWSRSASTDSPVESGHIGKDMAHMAQTYFYHVETARTVTWTLTGPSLWQRLHTWDSLMSETKMISFLLWIQPEYPQS